MIDYIAYSHMLTAQADMCFPFEREFFQSIGINNMSNIVEIGCGNGHFLKILSKQFPNRNYLGCDHCEEFIQIANQEPSEVNFKVGSIECLNPIQDLVILRLIVHQLNNRIKFMQDLANKLLFRSEIIIIEPFDHMFQIYPVLPKFNEHIAKHRNILSPGTASRDVYNFIQQEMGLYGFQLEKQVYYYIPSSLPSYKYQYYNYMIATCRIIGCQDIVLDEIEDWYRAPDSFAQIGLIMFHFKR